LFAPVIEGARVHHLFLHAGRAAISPRVVSTARHHSKRRTCFLVAEAGFGKLYLSSWRPA